MLFLLLVAIAAQNPDVECARTRCRTRVGGREPLAARLFEFAPSSGAGMGVSCAGTVPTGSRGEAITFSRASAATCCKADGTCVDLTTNQPIVSVCEGCSSGPLGVFSEQAVTNSALRCVEGDNAAWTAVAGGSVAANQYDGPFGAAELEQVTCASAGDGVEQVVSLATLNQKAFSVWLRSGTASAVTIEMIGTGNSAGDRAKNLTLTSTPTRYAVVGTAAYAAGLTAVTIRITCNGVTGTFGFGHAQLESDVGTYTSFFGPTSHIHTTSAAATRAANSWTFTTPTWLTNAQGCAAVSTRRKRYDTETPAAYLLMTWVTPYMSRPFTLTTNAVDSDSTNSITATGGSDIAAGVVKFVSEWSGATKVLRQGAANNSGAYDGTMLAATTSFGSQQNTSWMTDFILSNDPMRCR